MTNVTKKSKLSKGGIAYRDKDFLAIFWKLAAPNQTERETAALKLLKKLNLESEVDASNDSKENSSESNDAAHNELLNYTVERLLKGLGSTKSEARLGFSLGLTLLLERLRKRQIRSTFTMAEQCLFAMKTDTKLEETSRKLGCVFLVLALTKSGAFAKLNAQQKTRAVELCVGLSNDGNIADLACFALASVPHRVTSDEFHPVLFDKLSQRLSAGWEKLDSNGLTLLLSALATHRESMGKGFLKSHYGCKRLLCEENFDKLLAVCSSSTSGRESNSQHPVVPLLLQQLLTKSSSLLASFVAMATERHCEPTSPAQLKALVFSMLAWTAEQPDEEFEPECDKAACLTVCFTDKAIVQLRAQLTNQDSVLHSSAADWLGRCVGVKQSQAALAAIVDRLTSVDCLFDSGVPPTCRVCRLLPRLPPEAARELAERALLTANQLVANVPEAGVKRLTCCTQLLRQLAVGCRQSVGHKLCTRLLLFLAEQAARADDSSWRAAARAAFFKSLDSLAGARGRREHRRLLRSLASRLLPLLPADTCGSRCLGRGLALLEASNSEEPTGLKWGFTLVYVHLGFLSLADDAAAKELLTDVEECEKRALAVEQRQRQEKQQLQWPDVLLDSLATLLANPSHMLRSVVRLAVAEIAGLVGPGGVDALRQLLLGDADESVKEESGEEDADDEEEEDEQEEGEDEKEEEEDVGDSESSLSLSSGDSDREEVDAEFRRACKAALGDAACPSDVDADPSDLSDSAMERVDDALALAFKARRRRQAADRRSVGERRRQLWQLRLRLLDVTETLLDASKSVDCALSLTDAVGRLAMSAASASALSSGVGAERRQVATRATSLLRRQASKPAAAEEQTTDTELLESSVSHLLTQTRRSPCPTGVSEAAHQLVQALYRLRPSATRQLLSDSLANQLKAERPKLSVQFWSRLCSVWPELIWVVRGALLSALGTDSRLRPFDRAQLANLAASALQPDAWRRLRTSCNDDKKLNEFCTSLAGQLLPALASEAASVNSALLLTSLLNLTAQLLRRVPKLAAQAPEGLVDALEGVNGRGSDLRRGLRACRQLLRPAGADKKRRKRRLSEVEEKGQKGEEAAEEADDEEQGANEESGESENGENEEDEKMDTE